MLKRIVIAAVLALFSSQVFAKGVAEEAFPKFKWIDANAYQADGSRFGYGVKFHGCWQTLSQAA